MIDIFRHLAREAGVRAASRFLAQAEVTFERLAGMPHMGTRYEAENAAFAEVRYFPISPFKKYLVLLPAHGARHRCRSGSSRRP